MRKAIHPERFVTFIRPHVQVTPATVLEQQAFDGSGVRKIADIPEKRDEYAAGRELQFGSVNAARAFVKAINASAGETVCRVGRKVHD